MKHKTWISICLAAALLAHLTLPAFAAGPAAGALAGLDVSIGAGAVTWSIPGTGGGMVTINGPAGFRAEIPFAEGDAPSFVPALAKDQPADGTYRWEIAVDGAGRTSGAFTLQGGSLASPMRIEGGMEKDQVIADDLIVSGGACIGFDCESDEDFEFDTLRLKENNTRIAFEDSSAMGSFPSNDWAPRCASTTAIPSCGTWWATATVCGSKTRPPVPPPSKSRPARRQTRWW